MDCRDKPGNDDPEGFVFIERRVGVKRRLAAVQLWRLWVMRSAQFSVTFGPVDRIALCSST